MPLVTEAIAQRVETTAPAFFLRGALQVQAMPGDPLGIEIGRFGPVVAYRQRRRHELMRLDGAFWYTESVTAPSRDKRLRIARSSLPYPPGSTGQPHSKATWSDQAPGASWIRLTHRASPCIRRRLLAQAT